MSVRDRLEQALAAHRRSERRGRARLPHGLCGAARAAADAADARAKAGISLGPLDGAIVTIKDLFDVAGEPTRAGLAHRGRRCARHGRRAGRAAAARGRRRDRRQDQHERVRLLRRRHEPALRHAGQSGGPRARAGRLVVGRGGRGRRPDVRDRDRHRHRRLDAAFRRRSAASSATSRASGACRPTARSRSPSRSTRSARWRAASRTARGPTP